VGIGRRAGLGRTAPRVRDATTADAAACAAVYAPYVRDTAITFGTVAPTAEEMADRIAAARATHAWLVAEDADRRVSGDAYAGPFVSRPPTAGAARSASTSSPVVGGPGPDGPSARCCWTASPIAATARSWPT
jgi:hypothetical protein